jgi:hypothetical protein
MLPELYRQGIIDVNVYEDTYHYGCLHSFKAVVNAAKDDGVWYLQDDIIFDYDFKVRTEKLSGKYDVVCGFCSCYDISPKKGAVRSADMWYSFPCIYISKLCGQEFIKWLDDNSMKYTAWINTGKHDDTLFRTFMLDTDDKLIYNVSPNLVDHVDTYVGGSIVNPIRDNKEVVSLYFNEDRRRQEIDKICRLLPNE